MRTLNVNDEDFNKFTILKKNRPQDTSRAETFAYLLNFHKEMQKFKPLPNVVHAKVTEEKS